jgi:hypothetical protein
MFELFETQPDCNVQDAEYQRLLGYPRRHRLEGRALEIADAARRWYAEHGRPWIYAREVEALELSREQIHINGAGFSAPALREQFQITEVHSAVLVAVSAGPECEEKARGYWQEGKPDEYFFMEMFGSAVVEHLVTVANGRLCAWADKDGMVALPHYSPGYTGWDVSEQGTLCGLIRQQANGQFAGRLDVLESGMLRPKKSLLAVVGLTRNLEEARAHARLVPCESCSLDGCQYRRARYKHFLPQIEGVVRLQPGVMVDSVATNGEISALNHDAKYSINGKALRKWSQERLELKPTRDGEIEARFRYEGTTCSNMGRPIEYEYNVLLAPGRDRYRILEISSRPAAGDTGHLSQCEYLKDAESFLRAVAAERPLLGRPLSDVFTWERAFSPSGCYCDAERRAHKWGLVLEVIHFALVEREKAAGISRQSNGILE